MAIDPQAGSITPIFNPRLMRWSEHFRFEEVYVVDLTATGRAAVRLLKMNAAERVELRTYLRSEF